MNMVIGSAQFGMNYGITNVSGEIKTPNITKILDSCLRNNITTIDTANSYGDAEKKLGSIGVSAFKVNTKVKINSESEEDYRKIRSVILASLNNLNLERINVLFIHNPQELTLKNIKHYSEIFNRILDDGLARKIGISVYHPNDLDLILNGFPIGTLQFPFNLFDMSFLHSGLIDSLSGRGIELQARSIFLQGIILKNFKNLDPKFSSLKRKFEILDEICKNKGITKILAATNFLKLFDIDSVVFGVDNHDNLLEIIESINKNIQLTKDDLKELINHPHDKMCDPRFW